MTEQEQLREDLKKMIVGIAGDNMDAVKDAPLAFALSVCEVAHAQGVNKGLVMARDQISAALSR